MSEKQKRGCLVWLKYIVGDHLVLWGILFVFMTMLSGVIVICVGLFSCATAATAAILPVWCYRVIFVVVGSGLFVMGIKFWLGDVWPHIKERLR